LQKPRNNFLFRYAIIRNERGIFFQKEKGPAIPALRNVYKDRANILIVDNREHRSNKIDEGKIIIYGFPCSYNYNSMYKSMLSEPNLLLFLLFRKLQKGDLG